MKKIFFYVFSLIILVSPAHARYRPGLDWRTVRTDRFTIYYPRGHEEFAGRVLALSEEVQRDVSGFLGVEPGRCVVVLNPDTDVFNGFYAPFPNRISLYETPFSSLRGFGPSSDLIDLVYTHEYAHFVHITTRLGWWGGLTRIFGEGLAITNGLSPGWLVEGVTTVAETRFTDGGRGRSSLFAGRMYSFTEGRGLWGLSAAATPSPYDPPPNRIYGAGYFMVDYLTRTYGPDAVAELSRSQARHPISGTRRAIKEVTGLSPGAFYRDFRADFNAQAEAARDRAALTGLPAGRVLLESPRDRYPVHFWNPSGTITVLRTGYDRTKALVEVDPHSGTIIAETPTGLLDALGIIRRAADGRLVYGRYFLHPLGGGDITETDLATYDPRTGRLSRLTRGEHVFAADLSPDGSRFAATRRNGMGIDLVLFDADGETKKTLVSRPGVFWEAPCWSPDGTVIAAVSKVGQNADIVLVDPATGAITPLFMPDIAEDNEPSFSPDGRWIVFSSNRSGVWNIHTWDRVEERLYQLTSVPYAAGDPKVSPDGTMLTFTSVLNGVECLCAVPFNLAAGWGVFVTRGGLLPEPDSEWLQSDVSFPDEGIPLGEAYKPFVHAPWAASDEDGTMLGVIAIGADPLLVNVYTASFLYGLRSGRPGYDLSLINRSFWPSLFFRAYDRADEGNTIGGGRDYWYREWGGEASTGLEVIHRTAPTIIQSSITLGGRFRAFEGLNGIAVDPAHDRSVSIFGRIALSRIPDHAGRDLVPGRGQTALFSHEQAFSSLGDELPGKNTVYAVTQYVPSPLCHHGFELKMVLQRQSGLLRYDREESIPRGFHADDRRGGLNRGNNLRISADYHFPIRYVDTGFGVIAWHLYLLKGSLFLDSGAGWEGRFKVDKWRRQARMSAGGTLSMQGDLFLVPVETGFSLGYKTMENEFFTEFLIELKM